jgi:hypothetical protein
MKIFLTLILFSIVGCSHNDRDICSETKRILLNMPPSANAHEFFSNGEIHLLFDTIGGKKFGNFFSFEEGACLSSYAFKVDSMNATYIESYEFKNKKVPEIEGKPIVYKTVDFDRSPDSVYIEYLISNFSWENINFEISENETSYFKIPIKPHNRFAFILSSKYAKKIKSLPRIFILARFKAKMKGTQVYKSFFDTIDLKRKIKN